MLMILNSITGYPERRSGVTIFDNFFDPYRHCTHEGSYRNAGGKAWISDRLLCSVFVGLWIEQRNDGTE